MRDEDDSMGRRRRERRDSIRRMEGIARLEEETERIRAMAEGGVSSDDGARSGGGDDVQGNEHEEEQGEDEEEENLRARRKEQEEYAEQLMMFVRGRLGMFTSAKHQPSGSGSSGSSGSGGSATAAHPTAATGVSSASGSSSGAEASRILLENLQKQFGTGGSPKKGKYASPQKSLRARRRESRLWNSIGEIEDDFIGGNAGVGEEVERVEDAVEGE